MKGTIRKIEITRIAIISEVGWHKLQEFLFGSGKDELKNVSKSSSFLKCHFGLQPKEATKRAQGDVCHCVLVSRNMESRERAVSL
jgi:hypothetical protein